MRAGASVSLAMVSALPALLRIDLPVLQCYVPARRRDGESAKIDNDHRIGRYGQLLIRVGGIVVAARS